LTVIHPSASSEALWAHLVARDFPPPPPAGPLGPAAGDGADGTWRGTYRALLASAAGRRRRAGAGAGRIAGPAGGGVPFPLRPPGQPQACVSRRDVDYTYIYI
jgi:hypothetical protein